MGGQKEDELFKVEVEAGEIEHSVPVETRTKGRIWKPVLPFIGDPHNNNNSLFQCLLPKSSSCVFQLKGSWVSV